MRKEILVVLLFIALAAIFHFSSPNIPDNDSFFYMQEAMRYRAEGLLSSDFPWIYHSIIRELSSSLWYGFSVFLIPLTFAGDLVLGIKLAGVFLTSVVLIIYWLVMKRHQIKIALLWPLLLLFSAPNILFRLLMTRPQTISLGLGVLLFSFLITGGFGGAFLTSFGISWLHFNFFWLAIAVLSIVIIVKFFIEKKFDWKSPIAVFLGILLGWLSRPNPIGAAKLFYVQVVKQILEKQGGLPLLFGQENYPLSAGALFTNFLPLLLLWLAAISVLVWLYRKSATANLPNQNRVLLWSSAILSVLFFLISVIVARRAYDLWAAYGIFLAASVFSYLLTKEILRSAAKYAISGLLIFLVLFSGVKTSASMKNTAYPPDTLKEAALWLKSNSAPGDIVFNLHWSDFSALYFWNQQNFYVGGLDPIFQYDYNPPLYWKFHYLSADQVTKKTCGAIECTREMLEDTHDVLVNDFKAKYIVLTKQQNPLVYSYLESDPRFEKKLDTKREAIYKIRFP